MEENVRERDRLRESNQKTRKNTSPFLSRGTRKRRTMISGARESERERGVRDGVVCVVISTIFRYGVTKLRANCARREGIGLV